MGKKKQYSKEYITNNLLTEDQRQYIKDHYMEMDNKELAKNIGTNPTYVTKCMNVMGLSRLDHITDNDLLDEEVFSAISVSDLSRYQISNRGRIRRIKDNLSMKSKISAKGYTIIQLISDLTNDYKTYNISRLVALTFVVNDDPVNKTVVSHIDRDKLNNNASNLEWISSSDNLKQVHDSGRIKYRIGEECSNTSHSEKEVHELCKLCEAGYTTSQIMKMHPEWNRVWINGIRRGSNWTHISSQYKMPEVKRRKKNESNI